MKPFLALALAVGLATAPPAAAQDVPPVDPVRFQLAKELVAASGGAAATEELVRQMYGSMGDMFEKLLPPEQMPLARAIQRDIQAEMLVMVPEMMNQSVGVYARVFDERELRDLVAFQTSETGKSVRRKTPALMGEVMKAQIPYMQEMIPRLMKRVADRACEEAKCTPAQRQQVAAALEKAAPKTGS